MNRTPNPNNRTPNNRVPNRIPSPNNRPPLRRADGSPAFVDPRVRRARRRNRLLRVLLGIFLCLAVAALVTLGVLVLRRASGIPLPGATTTDASATTTDKPATSDPSATDPTTTAAPTTTEPPVPSDRILSLVACGDCIIHDDVIRDAQIRANTANPSYNFYDMFAGVADVIGGADLAFINMEGSVAGAGFGYNGYPNFNAPEQIAETFVRLGFDVVNIANNHMLDNGEAGLVATINYFKTLNFITVGGYTKADYDNLRVFEKNGIRVALLSYCEMINFGADVSASGEYLIPFIREETLTRQIALARQNADFVVVSMHWGTEDETQPNSDQKRYAQLCADLGADVVIGHHSHTVQPCEWLNGKNGNRTFVAYSLGNFISTQYYAVNMAGAMLSLNLKKTADGVCSVEDAGLIPTVTHYTQDPHSEHRVGLQIYRVADYTEELAAAHGTRVAVQAGAGYNSPFSLGILKKFYSDTVPESFLIR